MNMQWREAYCPAHFGNSYEAMWPREMANYLDELKYWGFNRYGDWMTCTDVCDPYHSDATWNLPMEQFARKRSAFRHAASIGLKNTLIIPANHVYIDQLKPHLLAQKTKTIFGQLLCPSIPEAREIILGNYRNIFKDLAENDIKLSALVFFAYDYGGCACDRCAPWITTFAELAHDIHREAQTYFDDIDPIFVAWWWKPDEYRQVAQWAATKRNWLRGLVYHLPYDATSYHQEPGLQFPENCTSMSFIHGGYSDLRKENDIYAKRGPVIAAQRLLKTLQNTAAQGSTGFQFYSEGVFDDINKAITAALSSGKASSPEDVLQEYAARYFGATTTQAKEWASWLEAWGLRSQVDLTTAAMQLEKLSASASPGWRLEHWKAKLRLESLDRALSQEEKPWDAERLRLAEEFWSEQERLQRGIYGLGPTRHIFNPSFSQPTWYKSWLEATRTQEKSTIASLVPDA